MKNKIFILLLIIIFQFCLSLPANAQFTEKILAVVNGQAITQTDVDEILAPIYLQYRSTYQGDDLEEKMKTAKKDILNQLIEDKLLLQEAIKQELTVDEKEVNKLIDKLKNNFNSEDEFHNVLASQNVTLNDLKKRYKEQLLIKKIVSKEVLRKVIITPTEITDYYEASNTNFTIPEQVRLRNIFVENQENEEKVEQKIKMIHEQLKNGVEFVELVEKYSESPNVVAAGDMGFLKRGSMRKEIETAVFKLAAGEITEPIITAKGYYIYKIEEKKAAQIPPIEDVQDTIKNEIYKNKTKQKLTDWINELKESTLIEVKDDKKES